MAQRFKISPVPTGEVSPFTSNPYALSSIYMFGSSSPFTGTGSSIVRPSDDLLIQKGGNRSLSIYQRLLLDDQVQGSFSKLMQEVTTRPWFVQEYSEKPGDLAIRDFVAETLQDLAIDDLFKGLAEALIVGFSVGEVMWKKTKRGVIPFDIRIRDQRRFVFQEAEDSQTGFTMRCLTFNRMFEGIELPARKFIVNRFWAQHNGDPYGSSLGRMLYPIIKFRRRALESYVLYGDRYATPTAVATAPLSASSSEIDTIYNHISNLSQETALVLPEGYKLEFVNPEGSPDVFKNLIEYLDKSISLLICGENEAGQAEAGSRASSVVANTVRVIKASEMSEMICHLLSQTLVRWIVDLNFGTDVAAPTLNREFRIEESPLTPADMSLLIQNGFKPKREWVARHFRVDLEDEAKDKSLAEEAGGEVNYDPEADKNLYESIFGDEGIPAEGTSPEGAPPEVAPEGAPAEGTTLEGTLEGAPEGGPPVEGALETPEESAVEPTDEEIDSTLDDIEQTLKSEGIVEGETSEESTPTEQGENEDLDSTLDDLEQNLASNTAPEMAPEDNSPEEPAPKGPTDEEIDAILESLGGQSSPERSTLESPEKAISKEPFTNEEIGSILSDLENEATSINQENPESSLPTEEEVNDLVSGLTNAKGGDSDGYPTEDEVNEIITQLGSKPLSKAKGPNSDEPPTEDEVNDIVTQLGSKVGGESTEEEDAATQETEEGGESLPPTSKEVDVIIEEMKRKSKG